jgi:hypothetical protein
MSRISKIFGNSHNSVAPSISLPAQHSETPKQFGDFPSVNPTLTINGQEARWSYRSPRNEKPTSADSPLKITPHDILIAKEKQRVRPSVSVGCVSVKVSEPISTPTDSLHIYNLTLDDIIQATNILQDLTKRIEEVCNTTHDSVSQQKRDIIRNDIQNMRSKIKIISEQMAYLLSLMGSTLLITLTSKEYITILNEMCDKAEVFISHSLPTSHVKSELQRLLISLTAASNSLVDILKEKKFLINKETEKSGVVGSEIINPTSLDLALLQPKSNDDHKRRGRRNLGFLSSKHHTIHHEKNTHSVSPKMENATEHFFENPSLLVDDTSHIIINESNGIANEITKHEGNAKSARRSLALSKNVDISSPITPGSPVQVCNV